MIPPNPPLKLREKFLDAGHGGAISGGVLCGTTEGIAGTRNAAAETFRKLTF